MANVIQVVQGGSLTIQDSNASSYHTDSTTNASLYSYTNPNSVTVVSVRGGVITGGTNGILNAGTLILSGGTITGNTKGILNSDGSTVKLSGNPVVMGNNGGNVQLGESSPVALNITGDLNNALIGVTAFEDPTDAKPVQITGILSGTDVISSFVSDKTSYAVIEDSDAQAMLALPITISFAKNEESAEGSMTGQDTGASVKTKLNDNQFTWEGHTFKGWNTEANGSGKAYANAEIVTLTASTTLYAQWMAPTVPTGKPAQSAPTGLAAVDATSAEAGDGMITGVTDAMEYSADDGKTWTKVPEGATEITGLVPGEYLVRFAETPDYNASEAVKLTVGDKSAGEAPGYDAPTYEALPEEDKQEADAIAGAHNTDKETAAQMLRYVQEKGISLDTVLLGDAAITGLPTSDEDPAGSSFGKLTARATKRAKTAITVTWKQLDDADGYLIYGNLCNKSNKLLKTLTQKDTTKWTQKKLKKRKFYKYMVVAYKSFGEAKMPIAASVYVHTATKGAKKTVAKKVKVNKTSVTLGIGETVKLKASEVKAEKKKLSKHRAIKYEVENPIIATVAEDGTITAVGEGTTTLYVYAQNGLYRIVTVTVTAAPVIVPNGAEEGEEPLAEHPEDALAIELAEPETEAIVEIDDGTVEDNDTAQIETEIILEDDATYME